MKRITLYISITLLLLMSYNLVQAQQDPMYTQYMFNTVSVNPGYAGTGESFELLMLGRKQWVGIDGAPTTFTLTAQSPIKRKNIGIGVSYINDKIGPTTQNFLYVDFAYHLKLTNTATLSMGLKSGFSVFNANLQSVETAEHGDPSFINNVNNQFLPNFGFGLYLYTPNYYIGLSTPKLIQNKYGSKEATALSSSAAEQRHYFGIAGYVYKINSDIVLRPSILTKYTAGAPLSVDLTLAALFVDRFWFGTMYRMGDSFDFFAQFQVTNQFKIGYAYDLTTTKLGYYNTGTHEILISYNIYYQRDRIKSPRYF